MDHIKKAAKNLVNKPFGSKNIIIEKVEVTNKSLCLTLIADSEINNPYYIVNPPKNLSEAEFQKYLQETLSKVV